MKLFFLLISAITVSVINALKHFSSQIMYLSSNSRKRQTYKQTEIDNDYEVVIIGSGLAGLSCGALLNRAGYQFRNFPMSSR